MPIEIRAEDSVRPIEEQLPLRHRIRVQLEGLIMNGALPPGTRLVEGELAQRLGVSRGPVRETLQLLANDGFVDLRPRQGAFVHMPTLKEVGDFYDIRGALECESARLAATRITPELADRLQRIMDLGRDLLARGTDPVAVNRQAAIHQEIITIADNPLLEQMLSTLNKRSAWYLSPHQPQRAAAWDEHEQIVQAIVRGDGAAASAAMASHNEGARANCIALKSGASHAATVDE
jgi:DNA-binding GntR family transcriptional regulator